MHSVTTVSHLNLHLGYLKDAFLQVFAGSKLIVAVDQVDLFGKAFQKKNFGEGVITPAHHGDGLVFEKSPVAGGAISDPAAGEPILPRDPQSLIEPPGDNNGAGGKLTFLQILGLRRLYSFSSRLPRCGFQAEALGLFAHPLAELDPGDPFREAREVLDEIGGDDLPAENELFDEQGLEPGPAGIDTRGQPGRAAANDDDVIIPRRHGGSMAQRAFFKAFSMMERETAPVICSKT